MSTITTTKRVCDRCGKEINYTSLEIIKARNKRKAHWYAYRYNWMNGYDYKNAIELCYDCKQDFEKFIANKPFKEVSNE